MKHEVHTSQKAVMELGIRGIDFNHMALYDFCKGLINWKGVKKTTVDDAEYCWVSYESIEANMPMLDCSTKTLYRMVDRLCDVRLLSRCPQNKKKCMVFLALGEMGIALEEYRLLNSTGNDLSMLTSDKNVRGNKEPRTKMSVTSDKNVRVLIEDNTKNNSSKEEYTGTPSLKSLSGARMVLNTTSKHRAAYFYNAELISLETMPKETILAAAPTPEKFVGRVAHYKSLAEFMLNGDSIACPGGMGGTVLQLRDQLTFLQYCNLIDVVPCTPAIIKEVILTMHNKYTKNVKGNTMLHRTLEDWLSRRMKTQQLSNGTIPMVPVRRPSSTNNNYSAK